MDVDRVFIWIRFVGLDIIILRYVSFFKITGIIEKFLKFKYYNKLCYVEVYKSVSGSVNEVRFFRYD